MGLPFDFAFEGFRILRARPRLVALWGLVTLFGYGLCCLILVVTLGPSQQSFVNLGTRPSDLALSDAMLQQALMGFAACAPVYLLTSSVLNCAVCRAGLDEGDDPFGFLRFGTREIHAMVLSAVTFALQLTALYAVIIVTALMRLPSSLDGLRVGLALLAVFWLRVRLSLNIPQSFATRRMDIFGSFALTRDRFWALAGGYLMAFGMAAIIDYLCQQVISAVLAVGFQQMPGTVTPDVSSLAAFLTPARAAAMVLWFGLVAPQMTAIMAGAPLGAWRAISPAPTPVAAAL